MNASVSRTFLNERQVSVPTNGSRRWNLVRLITNASVAMSLLNKRQARRLPQSAFPKVGDTLCPVWFQLDKNVLPNLHWSINASSPHPVAVRPLYLLSACPCAPCPFPHPKRYNLEQEEACLACAQDSCSQSDTSLSSCVHVSLCSPTPWPLRLMGRTLGVANRGVK